MANTFTSTLYAAIIASLILGLFMVPILDLNDAATYNTDIQTSNLSAINRLDDLSDVSKDIQGKVTQEGEVTTSESEQSFFSQAYTVGKFVANTGPQNIMLDMGRDFVLFVGLPIIVYVALASILIVAITFAIVKGITGR